MAVLVVLSACGSSTGGGQEKAQQQVNALKTDTERWTQGWQGVTASPVSGEVCADSGPGYIHVNLSEQNASGHALDQLPARLRADGWAVQGSLADLQGSRRMTEGFEATLVSERSNASITVIAFIPKQLCGS